jgi:hypothetical protein
MLIIYILLLDVIQEFKVGAICKILYDIVVILLMFVKASVNFLYWNVEFVKKKISLEFTWDV